jgi:NDP-sugar pyrophosphorylase family protein
VRRFVEKPPNETTPSHLINIGTWILSSRIIEKLPKQEVFSFERDYMSLNCDKEMICGFVTDSQFWPTDNMERYEKAIFGWRDHKARSVGKKKQ